MAEISAFCVMPGTIKFGSYTRVFFFFLCKTYFNCFVSNDTTSELNDPIFNAYLVSVIISTIVVSFPTTYDSVPEIVATIFGLLTQCSG